MDEEKLNEEDTESQDKPEIHEENSVDNEVKEESATDADDKEIINEEKTDDSEEVKEEGAEAVASEDKTDNQEKASNDESVNSDNQSKEVEETPEKPVEEIKKVEEPLEKPLNKKGKEGSFMPIFFVMIISLVIAFAWDKVPVIQNSVHAVLDPTAGSLLTWNLTAGMLLIVLMITLVTTVIQKYATDQEALKELKKEQKILQEEMKKYKDHPEKVAELSKKQFQFIPKTFKLTSRAIMFTGIPFILFFRWFSDVFITMEAIIGAPVKFLGFLSWFWFYLIFTMVFSTILRKTFKVV